jgi:catechol 2,3-dioxygenase-like lactoylglutathione lyase family enzyme
MNAKFEIADLDHVVIRCRDIARARDFYTGILGCTVERTIDAIGLIQMRAGAGMIDLVPADGESPPVRESRNIDHFCVGIVAAEMTEVARHLRELGVEVIGEPAQRYGARGLGLSIYIRDPEGNVVELKQVPSDAHR